MLDRQIKFKIDNIDTILNKFRNLNAVFIDGVFEKTTLFDNENGELQKNGIFIRTRNGYENTLTLKERDDSLKHDYFERKKTTIEIENVDDMNYVLKVMGLINNKVMEKYRLSWIIEQINVTIDELPYGVFLEIHGDDKEINKICELIDIKKENIINETYWDLAKQYGYLKKDIVFGRKHIYLLGSFMN